MKNGVKIVYELSGIPRPLVVINFFLFNYINSEKGYIVSCCMCSVCLFSANTHNRDGTSTILCN